MALQRLASILPAVYRRTKESEHRPSTRCPAGTRGDSQAWFGGTEQSEGGRAEGSRWNEPRTSESKRRETTAEAREYPGLRAGRSGGIRIEVATSARFPDSHRSGFFASRGHNSKARSDSATNSLSCRAFGVAPQLHRWVSAQVDSRSTPDGTHAAALALTHLTSNCACFRSYHIVRSAYGISAIGRVGSPSSWRTSSRQ